MKVAENVRVGMQDATAGDECAPVALTISIGVSVVAPGERPDPEDVIRAADAALYRAKREGRNRVVFDAA